MCPDKTRRQNLKSKRKRNLVKKAIELKKILDMDILMVMRDNDTGKYYQYASGNSDMGHFTWEESLRDIRALEIKDLSVKFYDDDDYYNLRTTRADPQDDEKEETTYTNLKKRQATSWASNCAEPHKTSSLKLDSYLMPSNSSTV